MEQYSVYNAHKAKPFNLANPLKDLLPDDCDRGWSVARNLIKPLNHLDELKKKEAIAIELNLHSSVTPHAIFDKNYAILARHQAGALPSSVVIQYLAIQLRQEGKPLSEDEIVSKLRDYAAICHMEFHPSDACNLTCYGCTYGHDDFQHKPPSIHFPFQEIKKIAQMKPKSMVIIGGGEPTLYKNYKHYFPDVVEEICTTNPGIVLALVTNGTNKPIGNWPNRFSWIRLSLDAASEGTYSRFRGKPLFAQVVKNFLDYLDFEVSHIGIGFLFAKANIHEYAAAAKFIFDLVNKEKPHALPKVNLQYRPLRQDPYVSHKPFSQALTFEQIHSTISDVRQLADSSTEMKAFLKKQTNVAAFLGGNTHPFHDFSRCYYSQTFRIVRANGDLRPCFIRVSEPEFFLGNILSDSLECIALNTLFIGAQRKTNCDGHNCRQCHVNYILEQGLNGHIQPSSAPEVRADPMY